MAWDDWICVAAIRRWAQQKAEREQAARVLAKARNENQARGLAREVAERDNKNTGKGKSIQTWNEVAEVCASVHEHHRCLTS